MVAAVIYVIPTVKPGIWPYKKINLGLDLQGGMHLVMEVKTDKAVEDTIEQYANDLQTNLRQENVRYLKIERVDRTQIEVKIMGQDNISGFNQVLDRDYRDLRELSRKRDQNSLEARYNLPDSEVERIKRMAVDQALETIRNRIDQFGVSEPDIRKQGEKRILIQLPGVKDTARAKELIGKTALLEFKLVDEIGDVAKAEEGQIPPEDELLYQVRKDPETNREYRTPFLLKRRTLLTGAHLVDARVMIDSQYNEPYVSIKFDRKGARTFEEITSANVNKRLAIVLDNRVYSAPVIQERIPNGEARISGGFTTEDAQDLAIVLRAGALPAPVEVLEERTVGATLGADSIRKGALSMIVGGLFVIIFMMIYYKVAGIIADLALLVNILLIAAGLAAFGATLTLPGIAGIILTIGMAVDANVLIFERIREELNVGKTPYAAVTTGFERATLTIMDANVTTLIAALVLFQFGTGPVKGFAVTLSLGVISSLFTALVLSRMIFDYLIISQKMKTVSI